MDFEQIVHKAKFATAGVVVVSLSANSISDYATKHPKGRITYFIKAKSRSRLPLAYFSLTLSK